MRQVCEGIEGGVDFDELLGSTGGDLLQAAEYLYLKYDRQIGPIRHQIERSFSAKTIAPLTSGAHVELVNLGASQIYTTNYDDIIEQTYKSLRVPMTTVILPKDVALADGDRTQVVKYHGDLSHERTLVLTESAYYKRLDFESPMDLKFRSDLLGRSVLFMGYSFRDINIRIIWFKLMDMMRDVPQADRRPSYIVRLDHNEALEELYSAVGLRTIVLDPDGRARSNRDKTNLLGEFLLSLSLQATTYSPTLPKHQTPQFVSEALLREVARRSERTRTAFFGRTYGPYINADDPTYSRLFRASVPEALEVEWESAIVKLIPLLGPNDLALELIDRLKDKGSIAEYVLQSLQERGVPEFREFKAKLLRRDLPWRDIWASTLGSDHIATLLDDLTQEIDYQAREGADEDIVYLAYLANRVAHGQLYVDGNSDEPSAEILKNRAARLVEVAATIYPAIKEMSVDEEVPDLSAALDAVQVRAKKKQFKPVDIDREILYDDLTRALRLRRVTQPRTMHE